MVGVRVHKYTPKTPCQGAEAGRLGSNAARRSIAVLYQHGRKHVFRSIRTYVRLRTDVLHQRLFRRVLENGHPSKVGVPATWLTASTISKVVLLKQTPMFAYTRVLIPSSAVKGRARNPVTFAKDAWCNINKPF